MRPRIVAGALLGSVIAGCASGSGDSDPAAFPSPVGELFTETQVATSLMPRRVAERMGVDREELRSAAGALQWELVDAAGVRMAVSSTGSGSPTVVADLVQSQTSPYLQAIAPTEQVPGI